MIRTLSRTAIGGSLRLIRLPIDGVLAIGGDRTPVTAAKLAVDRADARAREWAGLMLGDADLQQDAKRRREAADERGQALDLRAEAESRSEHADQMTEQRKQDAARRRKQAAETAKQKRRKAQQRRQTTKAAAGKKASQRREAAEKSAARTETVVEEKQKLSRLEQLDSKQKAVKEKEAALTAADEARRLRDAATAVKQNRKNDN
jgi:hypothetical protein